MKCHLSHLKLKNRRAALVLCLALSVSFLSCAQSGNDQAEAETSKKRSVNELPNIILIILDTVSAESAMPGKESTMPALSSIAETGYTFVNCMATSDLTTISHYSILSGMTAQKEENRMESEMDRAEYSLMNMLLLWILTLKMPGKF